MAENLYRGNPSTFTDSPLGQYETHRFVETLLEPGVCLAILEIGCGMGEGLADLARRFPQNYFAGIDLTEQNIANARVASPAIA
jgi:tRNA G46 methylase TrmB